MESVTAAYESVRGQLLSLRSTEKAAHDDLQRRRKTLQLIQDNIAVNNRLRATLTRQASRTPATMTGETKAGNTTVTIKDLYYDSKATRGVALHTLLSAQQWEALSSAEAEYAAAAYVCKELVFVRQLCESHSDAACSDERVHNIFAPVARSSSYTLRQGARLLWLLA